MTVTSGEVADAGKQNNVGYVTLLRQNPNFRNLWFSQLISAAGDWFNNVALLGLTLQLTHSGLATGIVLLCSGLPLFFLSPLAGPIIDRFDRRKVLIIANLLGALLALSFLLVRDASMVWLIYVGTILVFSTAAFTNPSAQAILPNIVNKQELFPANVLSGSTWSIMVMVGSGVGGLVSAVLGRDFVFILNSFSFLLGAYLVTIVRIPTKARQVQSPSTPNPTRPSYWREFLEGLVYLRQHLAIMALVAVKSGWSLAAGVIVLFSVFSQQIFHAGDGGLGLLFAARGLGALLGPILLRSFVKDDPTKIRLAIIGGFLTSGIGYLLFGFSANIGIGAALCALIVGHFGGGLTWTLSSILLQQRVPDHLRGRIFSVDLAVSTLINSVSTLIWSFSLEANASPLTLAWAGGCVFILYSLIWAAVTTSPVFAIKQEANADA